MHSRILTGRLGDERGSSLVETLLVLGLVILVAAIGVQGFAYTHARAIATAAAQDGVRSAATAGPRAGLERSRQVLAAGGGAARNLAASVTEQPASVTVTVAGNAPSVFPLSLILPSIRTSATLPLERYALNEQAAP
jgi:type II secretory pathway pseudopilin PulG